MTPQIATTPAFSREKIAARVQSLAEEIGAEFADTRPTLLVVLKGAAFFGADLARVMPIPVWLDYLPTTSYRGMWTTGAVSIGPLQPAGIFERPVILVEDVIDSGKTLEALWHHVNDLQPARLEVCTLFSKVKPRNMQRPVPVRYVGFEIEDRFIVGYGMDLDEEYRALPDVHYLR